MVKPFFVSSPSLCTRAARGTLESSGSDTVCERIREGAAGMPEEVRRTSPPRSFERLTDPLICATLGNKVEAAGVLVDIAA